MQKVSLLVASVLGFFLLAAGKYSVSHSVFSIPPYADTLVLDLPEEPFNYVDIAIPEYLLQALDSSNAPFLPLLDSITNAGATLGRVLFFEKRLSANYSVSCGSCHAQSQSFGAGTSHSSGFAGALTPRNTMHINHMAFSPGSPVFWDGRIQTIHDQVIMPILHPNEMGLTTTEIIGRLEQTSYYPALFEAAFGDAQITIPRVRSALVQFVVSMASFNSKFDQMQEAGDLSVFSPIEQQGWILFQEACVLCHIEGHFGTDSLFNIGLDMEYTDPGMAGWTGNPSDHGAFKSPTLRNIALAAPYMHDGRFASLEDVITFYSEEVAPHPNNHMAEMLQQPLPFRGFRYTPEEKAALVAFMHTLTDSTLVTHPKWSDPFILLPSAAPTEMHTEFRIYIFPNPARQEVVVEWPASSNQPVEIKLIDLSGKMLRNIRVNGEYYRLPLDGLSPGLYLLDWSNGTKRHTARLVVQ